MRRRKHRAGVWLLLLVSSIGGADQAEYDDADDPAHAPRQDTRAEDTETASIPRRFGTDLDPVTRVNKSLPKSGSVFAVTMPESYTAFKLRISRLRGLKVGVSYQSLYQRPSDRLSGQETPWRYHGGSHSIENCATKAGLKSNGSCWSRRISG